MLKSKQSSAGSAESKLKDEAKTKVQIKEEHQSLSSQKDDQDKGAVGLTQKAKPSLEEERKGQSELKRFEKKKLSTSALKSGKLMEYWSSKEWADLRVRLTKTQNQMKTDKWVSLFSFEIDVPQYIDVPCPSVIWVLTQNTNNREHLR